MTQKTILLVEDEVDVLKSNEEFLMRSGYAILIATTLAEAERILRSQTPDLVLLDIQLPDGSGLDLLARLREASAPEPPVIFLTCLGNNADMIAGLECGGCDYITKPYDFGVLKARIEAQLRKTKLVVERQPRTITRGPLTLDTLSGQAFFDGADMRLTPKEFALLRLLVRNEGERFTARQLYDAVWGQDANDDIRTVQVRVSSLRKKLKTDSQSAIALDMEQRKYYCLKVHL